MRKMKCLASMLLTLVIAFALLENEVKASAEDELVASVEKQIVNYGKSIAKSGSDSSTLVDMIKYSVSNSSNFYVLDEDDNLTATIMNSNLMQEYLGSAIANSIVLMQENDLDYLFGFGGPAWYDYGGRYLMTAFKGDEPIFYNSYGNMTYSQDVYGTPYFDYVRNKNDEALQLVVGSADTDMHIMVSKVGNGKITYDVSLKIYDSFDFNGTYDEEDAMGYDTTISGLLTGIGSSSLNPYKWEAYVSFQIETPMVCDHRQGNYQWTLDSASQSLVSAESGDFIANEAEKLVGSDDWNRPIYYHKLEESVKLYHDRPWVVEYTGNQIDSFHLAAQKSASSFIPYFHHESTDIVAFNNFMLRNLSADELKLQETNPGAVAYAMVRYYGLNTRGIYESYYEDCDMTFRLENKINDDGSNMIYLTISYEDETGREHILLEEEPMDDQAERTNLQAKPGGFRSGSSWLSGEDFIINYIGNRSTGLSANSFKLTIWTNGEDSEAASSYVEKYVQGNCKKDNVDAAVCEDCHHSIVKSSSKGEHSFGEYNLNKDVTCTTDGTKTAACKYCGTKKTIAAKGSALGHKPKKVRDCSATCVLSGYVGGEVCERCDMVLSENIIIPAKGHDFGEWVVTKKPTCLNEGKERRDCSRCNVYEERVAKAKGHTWSEEYAVDKPATYEEEGVLHLVCKVCRATDQKTAIPKLGSVSYKKNCEYTGDIVVPTVKVVDSEGIVLKEGTDYTCVVRNKNNAIVREPKIIGEYILHITYINKYSGNEKLNYSIQLAAPKNVKAKLTAHDDVKVSWSKVELAKSYLVYYKKSSEKTYTLYKEVSGTSATIKNLADNATYNFKVVARGMSSLVTVESKSSSVVKIKTLKNLVSPKNVTLKLTAHDDIKVSWKKVPDAKGYYVYYKKDTAAKYSSYKVTKKTSITLKDLADNTKYDIKIVPYGESAGSKIKSDKYTEKSIKTLRNLKAPQNLKLKAAGKTVLKATWSKSANAKGYYVYYKVHGTDTYKLYKTTTKTSIFITGLKKNTKYVVKVVPYGMSDSIKVKSDNYSAKALKTLK